MTRAAILALVEHDRGRVNDLSLQALSFGRTLAGRLGAPLQALIVGEQARPAAEALGAFGVSQVHLVVHDALDDYAPRAWARSLVHLASTLGPEAVLAAASDRSAEVMASAAAQLDAPLAANSMEVEVSDAESWTVIRQRWGGSLLEEASLSGTTKLLTIAPHAVSASQVESPVPAEVTTFTPELDDADVAVRVTERLQAGEGAVSLAEAKVVVGGGRGVGGADGFGALEELAGLLGGVVGCSRVVTSNGWRPHSDQIGQTGTRIAPDLYVACGISGATQHIVGCKAAKRILAVNTDTEAPILRMADYAVIGDLKQIVPAISAEIRKARGG